MFYFIKTPGWLKKLYSECLWQMPTDEKIIYLTFDDGPHPNATPFVLDTLKEYDATATFFCIGKNVVEQAELYKRIISEGHGVGNHTFHHLNGWKTRPGVYMNDIMEAKKHIVSSLFRPPYGRVTKFQLKLLSESNYKLTAVMWTVLSGDFDVKLTGEKCLRNVINNSGNGDIVVFHDSEKAYERLVYTLPKVLAHFTSEGFRFKKLEL